MIDVRGNAIDFRPESDWLPGEMDEVAMLEPEGGAFCPLSWSMRQNVRATME